jgi:hypothetical protein
MVFGAFRRGRSVACGGGVLVEAADAAGCSGSMVVVMLDRCVVFLGVPKVCMVVKCSWRPFSYHSHTSSSILGGNMIVVLYKAYCLEI